MLSDRVTAIVGYGAIGQWTGRYFPQALICDPHLDQEGVVTLDEVNRRCSAAIICVPTPWDGERKRLDNAIVADVMSKLEVELILIRSTLNVGDADMFKRPGREVVTWPEFVGESVDHPMRSGAGNSYVILGGTPRGRRMAINLLQKSYNPSVRIRQVDNRTAEAIKLSNNRAIAWKVLECQELFDVCEAAGLDYYEVREGVYGDDPRMNLWWSFVFPESRGMDSKCLPKDVLAWAAWAESAGITPHLTNHLLAGNDAWVQQSKAARAAQPTSALRT